MLFRSVVASVHADHTGDQRHADGNAEPDLTEVKLELAIVDGVVELHVVAGQGVHDANDLSGLLLDLLEGGKKQVQEVFDIYDNVSEIIENENGKLSVRINELLPKEEANSLSDKEKTQLQVARTRVENLKNITESVDTALGQLADCNN